MKLKSDETDLDRLRRQAEAALRRARSPEDLEPLLERIVELAPEGSDASTFAHRHLAELLLEQSPWRAALHLRRVVQAAHDDDVIHALLGLCHALLGNFRAAITAYRRALALSPSNPWYHHNLGHLLDVAIGRPDLAVVHLRTAHRLEPLEDEITASLAHCLAATGELEESKVLAEEAVRCSPRNRDHRALLSWVEQGAPKDFDPNTAAGTELPKTRDSSRRASARAKSADAKSAPESRVASEPRVSPEARATEVVEVLERRMAEAGFSAVELERARSLWADFQQGRQIRVAKPEVYAAAIECAMLLVQGMDGVSQSSVARRYGIAKTSLSSRFGQICEALALRPFDPRYAAV